MNLSRLSVNGKSSNRNKMVLLEFRLRESLLYSLSGLWCCPGPAPGARPCAGTWRGLSAGGHPGRWLRPTGGIGWACGSASHPHTLLRHCLPARASPESRRLCLCSAPALPMVPKKHCLGHGGSCHGDTEPAELPPYQRDSLAGCHGNSLTQPSVMGTGFPALSGDFPPLQGDYRALPAVPGAPGTGLFQPRSIAASPHPARSQGL